MYLDVKKDDYLKNVFIYCKKIILLECIYILQEEYCILNFVIRC